MGIKEDLELNIAEALKSVRILDTALTASANKFKADLTNATSVLTNVKVTFNTGDIKKNLEDAAKGATVTVKPKVDTSEVNKQLDLFNQGKSFDQLKLFPDDVGKPVVDSLKQIPPAADDAAGKTGASFKQMSAGAIQVGQAMTIGITLPLAAAGVQAVKTGNEYELAFSRMVGLANVPTAEVERLKEGTLELAGETLRAPNELAEALYFITSSGISAADALPVLERSALGAAGGLGRTKDVADFVTSALNAYGQSNLTAAQAVDVLTAGVRDGKGEPAAYAQVLGRILPVASKLGVGLDQVVASLSVMTKTGLSASEASISLNQVFNSFLNTTKEGEQVLAQHNLSVEKLRDIIKTPGTGVLDAMRLLDASFDGNLETLDKVIPNVRALRGFLNILAQEAGGVNQVFSDTTAQLNNTDEALGAGKEAFAAYAATTQAKMDAAKVAIDSALITVGAALAPVIGDLAKFVQGFILLFQSLSDGQTKAVLVIGAIAAALGPLLVITGTLIRSVQTIIEVGPKLAAVFTNPYFLAGAVAVGLIANALYQSAKQAAEAEARVKDFTTAIRSAGDVAAGVELQIRKVFDAQDPNSIRLIAAMDSIGLKAKDMAAAVIAGGDQLTDFKVKVLAADFALQSGEDQAKFTKRVNAAGLSMDEFFHKVAAGDATMSDYRGSIGNSGDATDDWARGLEKFAGKIDDTSEAVSEATERAKAMESVLGTAAKTTDVTATSFEALSPELQQFILDSRGATVSAGDLAAALDVLDKSMPTFAEAFVAGGAAIIKGTGGAANALKDLTTENKETTKAAGGASKAVEDEAASMLKAREATEKYEDSLVSVEKAQRSLLDAQDDLKKALEGPDELDVEKERLKLAKAGTEQAELNIELQEKQALLDAAKLKDRSGFGNGNTQDAKDVIAAQLEVDKVNNKIKETMIDVAEASKNIREAEAFDPNTDKAVLDAKVKVKDAETALQKTLRESKEAYEAISTAVNNVTTAQGGNASAIKEKYIPTIEEFTGKLASNFTDQLNFFNNIQTLVDRGAGNVAKAVVELAATDKVAAAELAANAVTLTDDRLAEQDRLIAETNAKNEALILAQRKLFGSLIGETKAATPEQNAATAALLAIPDDELIAASGKSAGQILGEAFTEGLIKGIGANAEGTANAARDGMNNAIKAAREAADAHSPSRVMIALGQDLTDGLRLGMLAEQQKAVAAAKGLVQGVVSAASGSQSGLVPVGAGLAGFLQPSTPTPSQTINDLDFNIQIDSVTADNAPEVGAVLGDAAARTFLARRNAVSLRTGGS